MSVELISKLHARLRNETASDHERFEGRLNLLSPDMSMDRYRLVLRAFYGFYDPVERGLHARLAARRCTGFSLPNRTTLLRQDLIAVGDTHAEISVSPRCPDIPDLGSVDQAAGCLYVLEGASLGGQIIARRLHAHLGLHREHGARFFAGDGPLTGSRWKSVLGWLDATVEAGAETDVVVESARDTFLALEKWAASQGAIA